MYMYFSVEILVIGYTSTDATRSLFVLFVTTLQTQALFRAYYS